MEEIVTTVLRIFGRVLGVWALFAFAIVGAAFAGNISKTFERGRTTRRDSVSKSG